MTSAFSIAVDDVTRKIARGPNCCYLFIAMATNSNLAIASTRVEARLSRISKATQFDRLQDQASPDAIARAAKEMGAQLVALTYNDPVIFLEYAVDVAAACRKAGLKTVAVTAGYITAEARKELFGAMEAAYVDLKGFTEDFYRTLCSGKLGPVLDTLEYVKHETQCWLEITMLLNK
jgi:pyruvate formate lyase activating enzyme